MTCLAAALFAAAFHVAPLVMFSDHHLVNGSITSVMHSEVRLAFSLSQWRIMTSSSIPLFHLGHAVGALNRIQPSLLFGNLYWLSAIILYIPGALNVSQNLILKAQAMPFGVTFWYHSQKSTSSRFKFCQGNYLGVSLSFYFLPHLWSSPLSIHLPFHVTSLFICVWLVVAI